MISELIVFSSLAFMLLLGLSWLLSPSYRAKLEQPKYAFLQQLQRHDAALAQCDTESNTGEESNHED